MMAILGSVVVAGIALYLWLAGHWFGRVLAFILFSGVAGFVVGNIPALMGPSVFVGLIAGEVVAWFAAGIPQFVRRAKAADEAFEPRRFVTIRHSNGG